MPYAFRYLLVIITIFSLLGPRVASGLSIYDVIMLSASQYESENIVDIILNTDSAFTLTAADVVDLKTAGVSDVVVQAMLTAVPLGEPQEAGTGSTGNTDWLNLTLADLLLLAKGEVSEAVILTFIKTRKITIAMGASEVIALYDSGLSNLVIQQLLFLESIAIDDPIDDYEPPVNATRNYPVTTEAYPTTVIVNNYPSDAPIYAYPRYYHQPYIYFGVQHRLHEHHRVSSHHQKEKRHPGLHHTNNNGTHLDDNNRGQHREKEHHVGMHDIEEGQHVGPHHVTPEHVPKYHRVSFSSTHTTGISKARGIINKVIQQSRHNTNKTNQQLITTSANQITGRGFNSHVHRASGNKIVNDNHHANNRNSGHTRNQNTTQSRVTFK